jgi:hypothetical protein
MFFTRKRRPTGAWPRCELSTLQVQLDEKFPEWGASRYFSATLKANVRLKDLLTHQYVLLPVLDDDKHY